MQREAAAGDNVRQAAVLVQKFVKIQIVITDNELNIHIRQLRLDIGGIFFVQRGVPQIDLNGFRVLLCFALLCAAAGQQTCRCYQYREQEGQPPLPLVCFHQPILLTRDSRLSPTDCPSFSSFLAAKRHYIRIA